MPDRIELDSDNPGWRDALLGDTWTSACMDEDHEACKFTAYCDCPCHDMCPDCNGTGGRHGIACRYDAEAVRALGGES